jgi:hypothetical protein
MRRQKPVPRWLRRLDLVKAELKGWRFPRTAQEGLTLCAMLSAANLRIFYSTAGHKTDPDRLLNRLRQAELARIPKWKRDCARTFGR